MNKSPTAIISYTHDNELHKSKVLELAQWLRRNGIDCNLDRFVDPTDWPKWMEGQLRDRDWIIVIATETYMARSRNDVPDGVGLGGSWEFAAIRQKLYEARGDVENVVPCIFSKAEKHSIPDALRSRTYYDLSIPERKHTLLAKLAGNVITVAPEPLGDLPVRSTGMTAEIATTLPRFSATVEATRIDNASIRPRLTLKTTTVAPAAFVFGNRPVQKIGSYKISFELKNRGKGAANRVRLVMSGANGVGTLGSLVPGDDAITVIWDLESQAAYRIKPQFPLVRVEFEDDEGSIYAQIGPLQVTARGDGTFHYSGGNFEAPQLLAAYTISYENATPPS